MKKLNILLSAFSAAVACVFISSCSHSHEPRNPQDEGTVYDIKLSLGGEYVDISQQPLTRAAWTNKKYYGINILRRKVTETEYTPYAYGVYDKKDISIKLASGYRYKFECTSVEDDVDKVATTKVGDYGTFIFPFSLKENLSIDNTVISHYPLRDLNKFVSSSTNYLSKLGEGKSSVFNGETDAEGYAVEYRDATIPGLMRYYGVTENYTPSGNGNVTIDMKSASFGIKVVVNGMPDGTLKWADAHETVTYGDPVIKFGDVQEKTHIFTFNNVKSCLTAPDNMYQSLEIEFTWERESGMVQTFKTEEPF